MKRSLLISAALSLLVVVSGCERRSGDDDDAEIGI
jgi:hypothetical protein